MMNFFVFGGDYGSGADDDHFQLGFTSKTLLSRITEGVIFHFDGTYKVIKFGFPLLVFSIVDINRKFWSIVFMFTSYEQKNYFFNFFNKLKIISQLVGIILNPQYFVIDASKAIAYAIERCFQNCKIIYFFNELEFKQLYIEKSLIKKKSIEAFHVYFKKQWVDSNFSNWQIYQTPLGFTTTNNPKESYNGKIKAFLQENFHKVDKDP